MAAIRLFVVLMLAGGLGGFAGSIVGAAFGSAGLFAGGVVGGLIATPCVVLLTARLRWIDRADTKAVAAGATLGFLAAVIVAVNSLSSPVGPLLSPCLVGIGGLGAGALRRRHLRWRSGVNLHVGLNTSPARAAFVGLVLAAPAVLFLAANILNELGTDILYAPVEALLSGAGRRQIFNVLSPILFLGGPAVALALNILVIARLDLRWDQGRLVSTLTIEPRAVNLAVLATGALALGTLAVYVAVENFKIVATHAG